MTGSPCSLCRHCWLPVGRRAFARPVNGEPCEFCCYGCCIAYQVKHGGGEASEAAWLLVRLGVGGFLSMNIMLFSLLLYSDAFAGSDLHTLAEIHLLLWALATPVLVILGQPFMRETWKLAQAGRISGSALVVLGSGAAYVYSALVILQGGGRVYFDTATMVLMLFTLGRYLEAAGRARAVRDLTPLLEAESAFAVVVEGLQERSCAVRDLRAGTLIRVRPGDRIPVDATIVEGQSHIDESVITGESRHVARGVGGEVLAGSINIDGPLLLRMSGAGDASRWARLCRSVREALQARSPVQRIAEQVAAGFVPLVLVSAGLVSLHWAHTLPFDQALFAGLAVLVVACPCAVGLAAPLALSLGIGQLARHGCVVRSAATLERLARIRLMAFDKTGTLTFGRPRLVDLATAGAAEDEVLACVAGLERHADHALARAVMAAAASRGIMPAATECIQVVPGRGVRGRAAGVAVAAGSAAFMRDLNWRIPPALALRADAIEASGHALMIVGIAGLACAVLSFDDTILPEAPGTVAALRSIGVGVILLTGDHAGAASRVAASVGVQDWQAGLLPDAKRVALGRFRRARGAVAMVGDGLNDGPVLAAADVGIAVASATGLAREVADLVLPLDGLWMLPWVVEMARSVRATVYTNLAWAFGYNLVAMTFAALGLLQPIVAAGIMAGSSLLVVMNSLRIERFPAPRRRAGRQGLLF